MLADRQHWLSDKARSGRTLSDDFLVLDFTKPDALLSSRWDPAAGMPGFPTWISTPLDEVVGRNRG